MAAMRQRLDLDKSFTERYFEWVTGLFRGDFGLNRDGQDVSVLLKQAVGTTFRLVLIALILSILLGILVGVISAVRQYSVIDYSSTFAAFLFFSLPVFWLAVLLKEFGAIRFNDYLEQPGLSTRGIWILTILTALIAGGIVGGSRLRRLGVGVAFGAVALAVFSVIDSTDWLANPGLSLIAVSILAALAGVVAALLFAPLENRRVLIAGLAAAASGVVASVLATSWIDEMSWTRMFLLLVCALVTGAAIGAAVGGEIDRRPGIQAGMMAAFLVGIVVVTDRLLSAWEPGRTIATIGPKTPNLAAPFWKHRSTTSATRSWRRLPLRSLASPDSCASPAHQCSKHSALIMCAPPRQKVCRQARSSFAMHSALRSFRS